MKRSVLFSVSIYTILFLLTGLCLAESVNSIGPCDFLYTNSTEKGMDIQWIVSFTGNVQTDIYWSPEFKPLSDYTFVEKLVKVDDTKKEYGYFYVVVSADHRSILSLPADLMIGRKLSITTEKNKIDIKNF